MTDHQRVRVFVADDHPLYREALTRAIKARPDLEFVGAAEDGRTALAQIRELHPDVCVLDVSMPALDGKAVLNAIVRDGLQTRVMFLSGHLESSTVYEALEGGAAGFVGKATVATKICDSIAAVARGETVIPQEAQGGLVEQIRMRGTDDRPVLTPREHEVLSLIAEGGSVPDIAGQLHLSPGTVKTHLSHLYQKLGVSERAAAVAQAIRMGLIE